MKHLLCVSLCVILISNQLSAQKVGDPYPSSAEVLLKANSLFQEGKYKEAAAELSVIEQGDSLSNLIDLTEGVALMTDSQFTKASEVFENMLKRPTTERARVMQLLAATTQADKNFDRAKQLQAQLESEYGFDETVLSFLGLNKEEFKEHNAALAYYEKALLINWKDPSLHKNIGLLAAKANQPALAVMAFEFASMLAVKSPEDVVSYCLTIEKVAKGEYVDASDPIDESVFAFAREMSDLNDIVLSGAAQSKSYKCKIKPDFNFARVVQVVCEKMPQTISNENSILQFYTSFYRYVWSKGLFQGMIAMPLELVDNAQLSPIYKNYSSKAKVFVTKASEYLTSKIKPVEFEYHGKKETSTIYYDQSELQAIGEVDKAGNPVGAFRYFHPNLELSAEGSFVNGAKDGEWKYYSKYGILSKIENYSKGILNGKTSEFSDLGIPVMESEFVNGKQTGVFVSYNAQGGKDYDLMTKDGVIDGEFRRYDGFDNVTEVSTFKNNKRVGKVINYHANGKIYSENTINSNGESEGPVTFYNDEGKIETTGQFSNSEREGEWKWFFPNGKVEMIKNYSKGKEDGTVLEYNEEGILLSEEKYNSSKLNGECKYYDSFGKLLCVVEYKNGKGISYFYYDVDGKILSEAKSTAKKLNVVTYNDNRFKDHEGMMEKNERVGEWITYFPNGTIKVRENYVDGLTDGPATTYHGNGKVEYEYNNVKGNFEGYFVRYDNSGRKNRDGYYLNGKLHGPVREYRSNGQVSSYEFYWHGKKNGTEIEYDLQGRESTLTANDFGVFRSQQALDSTGRVYYTVKAQGGTGDFNTFYANGQKWRVAKMKLSSLDGDFTEYTVLGTVLRKLHYSNGNLNGQGSRYYFNGQLKEEGIYKDGNREGVWKNYTPDGKLDSEITYKNDERNGLYRTYYASGKILQERNYKDDLREGELLYYAEDGTLAIRMNYHQGVLLSYSYLGKDNKEITPIKLTNETGTVTAFYPSGKKSMSFKMVSGEYDGDLVFYNTNGKEVLHFSYVNGVQDGKSVESTPSGVAIEISSYVLGEDDGVYTYNYTNGKPYMIMHFVKGVAEGSAKCYSVDGKLISEGKFIDGLYYAN